MSHAVPSILRLPPETLQQICSLCSGSLKALRLSHPVFSEWVSPDLFNSITLVPHTDSFDNALQLSANLRLARHVRSLVYDLRMVSTAIEWEDADRMGQFRYYFHLNQDGSRIAPYINTAHEDRARAFTKHEDVEFEISALLRILPRLVKLRSITITCGSVSLDGKVRWDPLPRLYQNLAHTMHRSSEVCSQNLHKTAIRARSLFLAVHALLAGPQVGVRDMTISILGVNIRECIQFTNCDTPYSHRRTLSKIFSDPKVPCTTRFFEYDSYEDRKAKVCLMIHQTLNSTNLRLSLIPTNFQHYEYGRINMFSLYDHLPFWPNESIRSCVQTDTANPGPFLRSLTLTGLSATHHEVQNFLQVIHPSLKSLMIGDWQVLHPRDPPHTEIWQHDPEWMPVLSLIANDCHTLQHARLVGSIWTTGTFPSKPTASFAYKWLMDPPIPGVTVQPRSDSLKSRLEEWLVRGGECPIDCTREDFWDDVGDRVRKRSDDSCRITYTETGGRWRIASA